MPPFFYLLFLLSYLRLRKKSLYLYNIKQNIKHMTTLELAELVRICAKQETGVIWKNDEYSGGYLVYSDKFKEVSFRVHKVGEIEYLFNEKPTGLKCYPFDIVEFVKAIIKFS